MFYCCLCVNVRSWRCWTCIVITVLREIHELDLPVVLWRSKLERVLTLVYVEQIVRELPIVALTNVTLRVEECNRFMIR